MDTALTEISARLLVTLNPTEYKANEFAYPDLIRAQASATVGTPLLPVQSTAATKSRLDLGALAMHWCGSNAAPASRRSASKRKKPSEDAYDESDAFIDDSVEADNMDDGEPLTQVIKYGGFYVSTGDILLTSRKQSANDGDDSDDFQSPVKKNKKKKEKTLAGSDADKPSIKARKAVPIEEAKSCSEEPKKPSVKRKRADTGDATVGATRKLNKKKPPATATAGHLPALPTAAASVAVSVAAPPSTSDVPKGTQDMVTDTAAAPAGLSPLSATPTAVKVPPAQPLAATPGEAKAVVTVVMADIPPVMEAEIADIAEQVKKLNVDKLRSIPPQLDRPLLEYVRWNRLCVCVCERE